MALPRLDANITEATIGEWHKCEGESVAVGDLLCEVITDKANFELEAEVGGVLRKILAPEKSQVPLGYVVALVGEPDEVLPDVTAENEKLMSEYLSSVTGKAVSAPPGTPRGPIPKASGGAPTDSAGVRPEGHPGPRERVRATPRARRLAREHHIDLVELQKATGVEMISEKEVQAWIEESKR